MTAVVRDDERPCTTIKIGNVLYAALWPRGATREATGVRVDGHLYRFGESTRLRGRTYDGGPTTTACVARDLWLVLESS